MSGVLRKKSVREFRIQNVWRVISGRWKRHRFRKNHMLVSVYTKRQRRANAEMMLVTQHSLKSMESLQNGLQPHSGATLFVPIDFKECCVASAALTLGVNEPFITHDCLPLFKRVEKRGKGLWIKIVMKQLFWDCLSNILRLNNLRTKRKTPLLWY